MTDSKLGAALAGVRDDFLFLCRRAFEPTSIAGYIAAYQSASSFSSPWNHVVLVCSVIMVLRPAGGFKDSEGASK